MIGNSLTRYWKRTGTSVVLLFVAAGSTVAQDVSRGKDADLETLRGTWICVVTLNDGAAVDKYVGVRAVIDGENLTWFFPEPNGKYREQKNKFRIDATQNPRSFDSWPADRPKLVDLRIYAVGSDTLRWATNLDGKTRPAAFEAARWQFTMKRVETQ